MFKWNGRKYLAYPFNFYLHPSSKFRVKKLNFQASAMEFLTDNKMDWNKVFKQGISYSHREKSDELKEQIEKYIQKCTNEEGNFEGFDKITRDYYTKLGRESQKQKEESISLVKSFLAESFIEDDLVEIRASENQACWQETKREIFNLCEDIISVKVTSKKNSLVIEKLAPERSAEEEKNLLIERLSSLNINDEDSKVSTEDVFDEEYGFTKIVDLMILSNLPIVGHYMSYDIMLLYQQCIGELPSTYDEFR